VVVLKRYVEIGKETLDLIVLMFCKQEARSCAETLP